MAHAQAYASGQLDRNDIVLKVDGAVTTNDNILQALVSFFATSRSPLSLFFTLARSLSRR